MNQYYEKIMGLKEAEEYKVVVKRWQNLSDRIKTRPTDAPIILPDMLWVAKSGVGKTNLLKLTSEYLSSLKNIMEFYGDVKYMEFAMGYCSPNEPFSELRRLVDEIENAAGFRNEYKGIVYIDINEWLDHFEEKHFITFMEYLAANSKSWLIVLCAYSESKTKLHNLTAFLSMYLRLERINLSLPKTEDLFDHIEYRLNEYGLSLDDSAKALLLETVEKIRKNKYFDGFKTIGMLCQDIVYSIYSKDNIDTYVLSADHLAEFSANSKYVSRTVANIERVNQIGLVNRRD